MSRWTWYFTCPEGWREFEREIEGGGKWALVLIGLVALLVAWGR
ncbi:MAG TPA: hypothetical protein VGK94_07805 [Candidatus Polarisedimenticolia bacterium]|jgi:hypothetical protein